MREANALLRRVAGRHAKRDNIAPKKLKDKLRIISTQVIELRATILNCDEVNAAEDDRPMIYGGATSSQLATSRTSCRKSMSEFKDAINTSMKRQALDTEEPEGSGLNRQMM
jgi:hypothetical protein